MGAGTPAQALLRRLDADAARAIGGREPVVIAFSGGLGSLILAALIRKRCSIACEVLGLPGSADVEAARVAEKFLDYPVSVVRPEVEEALRAECRLVNDHALPVADAMALVPLVLLEALHPGERVVSGFGMTWDGPRVRTFLASAPSASPGLRLRGATPPSRGQLLGVADLLGLPAAFSRAARRRPAEGSGVGPALRAAAHAEHVTLDRLIRRGDPSRDNHKRSATPVVPKSSPVD